MTQVKEDMMRGKVGFGLALVVAVLCIAGVIVAYGNGDISWNVMAGGGGTVTEGHISLDNTIGQVLTGLSSDGSLELCTGFWCVEVIGRRVYLPMVVQIEE